MPVRIRERPSPSRFRPRTMSVSRVFRSTRAACAPVAITPSRSSRSMPASVRAVPSACRKASFSSSVPTLTRRQRSSIGYEVTSRTSTPRRSIEAKTAFGSAARHSSRKKFASEGAGAHARHVGEAREEPLPLRDQAVDARRERVLLLEGGDRRRLREEVEVVGQARLVDLAHQLGRGEQVADAQPGQGHGLREGAEDDQVRVALEEGHHGPGGELVVRLVDHHEAVAVPAEPLDVVQARGWSPWGCSASRRS